MDDGWLDGRMASWMEDGCRNVWVVRLIDMGWLDG